MIDLVKLLVIAINFALISWLFFMKYRQNSPFQFFYLALAGLVIWPALSDPNEAYFHYHFSADAVFLDAHRMIHVHLLIFAYLSIFLFLELVFPPEQIELKAERNTGFSPIFIPPILLCAGIAYALATFSLSTLLTLNFLDIRQQGSINTVYLFIVYMSALSVFFPAYMIFFRKRYVLGLIGLGVFAAVYMIFGGARQFIVIVVLLVIYVRLIGLRFGGVAILALFVIGFPLAEFILTNLKVIRNISGFEDRVAVLSDLASGTYDFTGISSESVVRGAMYTVILEPLPTEFKNLDYLRRAFLFWLPSPVDVLKIKPEDFEYTLFAHVMNGRIGSMHATYFGSTFADAGYFFPIWCLFTFLVMRFTEKMITLSPEPFFLWSLGAYVSIMSSRGALYAVLVVLFIGMIISWIRMVFERPP